MRPRTGEPSIDTSGHAGSVDFQIAVKTNLPSVFGNALLTSQCQPHHRPPIFRESDFEDEEYMNNPVTNTVTETRQYPPHHRPLASRKTDRWGEPRQHQPHHCPPIPRESDRWSETRHRRTPELETLMAVRRIPAHQLLERLTSGVRQDSVHRITTHPFLERVTDVARPDIAAHPSVRHQSWSETKSHTHMMEWNMGQSPYLCSGSAGFCCWGLGKGRPFPHVKAWRGTAQITTQGHRGTLLSGRFQISGDRCTQLLRDIRSSESGWHSPSTGAPAARARSTQTAQSSAWALTAASAMQVTSAPENTWTAEDHSSQDGGLLSEATKFKSEVDRFLGRVPSACGFSR
jgi:hypothetical protein